MEIKKERNGNVMTVHLSGRLGIKEAKELNKFIQEELNGVTDLTFDLAELSYIASAGLRVLLIAQDTIDAAQGSMKLVQVNHIVLEVLQLTGFIDFMNVED